MASERRKTKKSKKQAATYVYDVCLLPDQRRFFVNKHDQSSHWLLPEGGIPCYPTCDIEVTILKCKGVQASGQVIQVHERRTIYCGNEFDKETHSKCVFETPKASKLGPERHVGWNISANISCDWDEGSLVFTMVTSAGFFSSSKHLGTATLNKNDLFPGNAYKLMLDLQGGKAISLEVIVDVGWPSQATTSLPPQAPSEAQGSEQEAEKETPTPAWQADEVVSVFQTHDMDGNGCIDRCEFSSLLHAMDPSWENAQCESLFRDVDVDGSGYIEYAEFVNYLFRGTERLKDRPACKYVAQEGDMIFIPDWLPTGRLLIRASHRFSFVTQHTHRFSSGVQGQCVMLPGNKARLEASLFGSKAKLGGAPSYTVLLEAAPDEKSGSNRYRACSLPLDITDGWLQPPEKRQATRLALSSGDQWELDDILDLFDLYDADKSGTIDKDEFAELMSALMPGCDEKLLEHYFNDVDVDGNERVDYFEFLDFLFNETGLDKSEDYEASKYVAREGEMVFIPDWLPSARLLVRAHGRFSFVWDSSLRYSRGVQGQCTIDNNGIITLEASLFGSASTVDSECSYVLRVGEEDESCIHGCRSCSQAPPFPTKGWLFPPPKKPWTPGKPIIIRMRSSVLKTDQLVEMFETIDTDRSTEVSRRELAELLKKYMPEHTLDDINSFMALADKDVNGSITYAEFLQFVVDFARNSKGTTFSEATAGTYAPEDGEKVYMGNFNPHGRLLVRSTGTFSYATSPFHKFSHGVQGRWTSKARSREDTCIGKECILQAQHFGPSASDVGKRDQAVALFDQPYSIRHDSTCRGCLLVQHESSSSADWGWLRYPDRVDDQSLI
eukprot:TRINITY_DN27153_c0_g1_i1.p1 TRINITY_DN27153_c0_g1~~TRINITY_DN27153_c0_g1_i1.p1  ORF type:complete len:839 (+),score=130.18 TRINITY_DN27153_c0_g1_i1:124-2640(+)